MICDSCGVVEKGGSRMSKNGVAVLHSGATESTAVVVVTCVVVLLNPAESIESLIYMVCR